MVSSASHLLCKLTLLQSVCRRSSCSYGTPLLNPEKGSIWFLVGLACRTCVDLGFHNERNAQKERLDNLETDMRRRLFWCTYKMDRLLSVSLGRPVTIPDGFINVPVGGLDATRAYC